MILGLTGSMGSGKSTVADCLKALGAPVISADELAREVVAPGTEGLAEIVRDFGTEVLDERGRLDRARVAALVFGNEERLRRLEAIIHPRVRNREEELIRANSDAPLVVLDVPLLFETGADELCDAVVSVTVDEAIRRARLMHNRGWTDQQINERLARQLPQSEKDQRADYVIDNSGSVENTRRQVELLYRNLIRS